MLRTDEDGLDLNRPAVAIPHADLSLRVRTKPGDASHLTVPGELRGEPLPILLAHRLSAQLARDRQMGRVAWLRPDAKTQVSVRYRDGRPVQVETVLVSTQHSSVVSQPGIEAFVREDLLPRALGEWFRREIAVIANPSGSFVVGGPSADAGVTGRKIIVDTYGGFARHGGGAFSGKDPSKVDRSGAYFCRWVARKIVDSGLARRAEVQVAYAIG